MAAIELAEVDPGKAVERLNALIDVYDDDEDQPPSISDFIDEAKKQLPGIRQRVRRMANDKLELIGQRLEYAQKMENEDPEHARKIYQGIVDLYGDRSWADEKVEQARLALGRLSDQ